MNSQESEASSQRLTWTGSRRDVLKTAVGGALFVSGGSKLHNTIRERLPQETDVSEILDTYLGKQGFEPASAHERKSLLGKIEFFDLEADITPLHTDNGIMDITFSLDRSSYVVVNISGEPDKNVSLPVLKATHQNNTYLIPILQNAYSAESTIALKNQEPMFHNIHVSSTSLYETQRGHLNEVKVKMLNEEAITPFGKALLDSLPLLGIQAQFGEYGIYNDDAPFFRTCEIYQREDGLKRVLFMEGRTAENGGTPPQDLLNVGEHHRLYDYDHSLIVTLDDLGRLYEVVYQHDIEAKIWFGLRHHIPHQLSQIRLPGPPGTLRPKDVPGHFSIHSVPPHGMVEPGFAYNSWGQEIREIYSLFPNFDMVYDTKKELETLRARKLTAVREHEREIDEELRRMTEDPFLGNITEIKEDVDLRKMLQDESKRLESTLDE